MTIEQAVKELKGNASVITVSSHIAKITGENIDNVKPRVKQWLFNQYPNAVTIIQGAYNGR